MYDYKSKTPRKRFLQRFWSSSLESGREFSEETNLNGFNHIFAPRRTWFERVLWTVATAASVWGVVHISQGQWQRYNDSPTVVAVDKDLKNWAFDFPAITACAKNRTDPIKMLEVIKTLWHVDLVDEKYEYYANFVSTVANSDLLNLQEYRQYKDDETLNVDLLSLAVEVQPQILMKIIWDEGLRPPHWHPVMTESGACYTANSIVLDDITIEKLQSNYTSWLPMTCNYTSLSCKTVIQITSATDIYTHSPYDIADISDHCNHCMLTLNRGTELSVAASGSGRGLADLTPDRRACRYYTEPLPDRKIYSASTCKLACRSRLARKLCDCTPFYYFYDGGVPCTPAGMACLSEHAQVLSTLSGEPCPCAQQCIDSAYLDVTTVDTIWDSGPLSEIGSIKISVLPPRTRYTREIVFYFQDLVVSFGGAIGLFLGASFISFVEVFYFFANKMFGLCMPEQKIKEDTTTKVNVPNEAIRIQELNKILEDQKRFEEETLRNNDLNYYTHRN